MTMSVAGVRPGPGRHSGLRGPSDLATGLMFAAIGGAGLWFSRDWAFGTLMMMDSGFFPRVLSAAVLLSGFVLIGRGLVVHGEGLPSVGWRPLIGVTLAVFAFAFGVQPLGLALAILAVVAISSFAGTALGVVPFISLWVVLTALCYGIFIWGVELPLRLWPF